MHGRAMCVTVQQNIDTVITNDSQHFILVDVRDALIDHCAVRDAFSAQMFRNGEALRQGFGEHHGLPFRIARYPASVLILHVIDAQRVAVAEQYLVAVEVHRVWVGKNPDAGFPGKHVADHEVAIAVHEVGCHAAVHEFPQRLLDDGVVRIRIVVTDPHLEQVTPDIERVGAARFSRQEGEKLIANFGSTGLKVQIGNEKSRHRPELTRNRTGTSFL